MCPPTTSLLARTSMFLAAALLTLGTAHAATHTVKKGGDLPTIKAGIGVAAFFCFMFSWVELLLAKTLTAVAAKPIAAIMTKTASSAGYELGLLAAAGCLTIIPGAFVIYFVRNYIAKGFALGRV